MMHLGDAPAVTPVAVMTASHERIISQDSFISNLHFNGQRDLDAWIKK
jgi:hypothetical protein